MVEEVQPIKLVYVYAQPDENHCTTLDTHLHMLKQQQVITTWSRKKIIPGQNVACEIEKNLNTAQIILLMISPDFLASEYTEIHRAMEYHKERSATVIPILLRPSDWKESILVELKPLPDNQIPVSSWAGKDNAWGDVVEGVRRVIEEIKTRAINEIKEREHPATIALRDVKEPGTVVYLESIEKQKFSRPADHKLSWYNYFVKEGNFGGHQLKDPANWNKELLPRVEELKKKINRKTECRLIRLYGKARLSCWFAFGFVFRDVTGYVLEMEVEPNKLRARTDRRPTKVFRYTSLALMAPPMVKV